MTKIYELRKKNAAYFETTFCGQTVPMEFTVGTGSGGEQRAEMIVYDKFTQDAVEADPRFGKEYRLAMTFGDDGNVVKPETKPADYEEDIPVVEDEPAPKRKASKKKTERGGNASTNTTDDACKVFGSVNDAVYYLEEELGIETNGKNLEALMKENKITVKEK